jgi:hypothetical protein
VVEISEGGVGSEGLAKEEPTPWTSLPDPDHHAFGPARPISTTFATRPLLGNPAKTYLHGPRFNKHPDMQAYLKDRWSEAAPTRQGMAKGTVAEGA